jgi:NAD(P)-dependent dehydrogenase (short-subunit alcohol dehydrogenase family)
LEINLIGTADFTEKILHTLSKNAHIVFVSSEAGSITLTEKGISHEPGHYPAYKISKAALNMYMATLATRTVADGLIISSVHPGWVKTAIGGDDAPITPEEAAEDIFKLAISKPATGGFWFKGKREPW